MDLATVTEALNVLYGHGRHLPRPAGLAQVVLDAGCAERPGGAWHLAGVVAALWPIGAAAGARRGHVITVGAIRGELAQALTDPAPDERGRWVIAGMVHAADALPPGPDPERRYRVADAGRLVGDPRRLDQALAIGLGNSWRAGHRDGTDAAITRFAAGVVDLVGHQRLVTTFLVPTVTGEILLEEIGLAAYRAAQADREHPNAPAATQASPNRPAASRAFAAPRRVNPQRLDGRPASSPTRRLPTAQPGHRSTGPGRRDRAR